MLEWRSQVQVTNIKIQRLRDEAQTYRTVKAVQSEKVILNEKNEQQPTLLTALWQVLRA